MVWLIVTFAAFGIGWYCALRYTPAIKQWWGEVS
jgi:hypothetical protein